MRIAPVYPDWPTGLRIAAGLLGPLVVGDLVDEGSGGLIAALFGLHVAIVDPRGAYAFRARVMLVMSALFIVVAQLAHAVASWNSAVLALTALLAMLAALVAGFGRLPAFGGLITAVVGVVFAYGDLPIRSPLSLLVAGSIGCAWVMLIALAPWPLRARAPAAATISRARAALASQTRRPDDDDALAEVRSAVVLANEVLASSPTDDDASRELASIDALASAIYVVGRRCDEIPGATEWLDAVSEIALSTEPLAVRWSALDAATTSVESTGAPREVVALARSASAPLVSPPPSVSHDEPSARTHLAHIGQLLLHPARRQRHHAVRFVLAMVAAGALTLWGPFERALWIPLTVLIVLAPTTNATLTKGVQRTVGTLAGVVVALAFAATVPQGSIVYYVALGVVGVLGGALMPINYGIAVIFITVLIIALDASTAGYESIAEVRLIDTVVGAAIGLTVGIFVWPHHPRDDLREQLSAALRTTASFAGTALSPRSPDVDVDAARRNAVASLAAARMSISEASADWSRPAPIEERRLAEAIHSLGVATFDLGRRFHVESPELDRAAAVTRDETVRLTTHIAEMLADSEDPSEADRDGDSAPVPALWPRPAHAVAEQCAVVRGRTISVVATTE